MSGQHKMTPFTQGPNASLIVKATRFQIDITYFLVLAVELILPFVAIMIATLYRKSLWINFDFPGRQQCYDIHVMRREDARTKLARIGHIISYRHRPLPLEVLRTCLEIAVFMYLLGYVRLVILLPIWCICDLAQGLHVLNLVYLRHTQLSRDAVRLATYIEIVYSLLFGFPMGFVSKLMWIVWIGSEISFQTIFVPMYIAAVGAFVFTLCYMLPTLCWTAAAIGCKHAITRLQVIVLLFCYCAMWMVAYYNLSVCAAPPVGYTTEGSVYLMVKEPKCQPYFVSWTTAFLPFSVILVLTLVSLMFAILEKSMLYRFLPEMAFIWSGTIVFITSLYKADGAVSRIVILPIVMVSISIVLTIIVNSILIKDVISGLRAPVIQVHEMPAEGSRSDQDELKRRREVRLKNLSDFALEGGKTSLKGTLLMHLKKRDRMRQCVVCFDEFTKSTDPTTDETEEGDKDKVGTAPASVLGIIRKCGHYFHFNCVWDWIQRENNCPLCRTVVEVTKEAIKTVQYDDVRYALDRNRDNAFSTMGTANKLVSDKNDKKSRPSVSGTLFKRDPRFNEGEPSSFVHGDRSATYRIHTRPTSKHCGLCNRKFLPHRHSRDIVVGYIRSCGHYFHWDCVDKYVIRNERCPTCDRMAPMLHGEVNEGLEQEGSIDEPNPNNNRSGRRSGNVPTPSASNDNSYSERSRPNAEHPRPGRSKNGGHGKARGRSSSERDNANRRRPQTESKRSHVGRAFNPGDSVRGIAVLSSLGDVEANQRPVPGPSSARGGHYKRNPRTNAAAVNLRQNVSRDDILFAFLSDVQRDIQRQNRRPQPSTIHGLPQNT